MGHVVLGPIYSVVTKVETERGVKRVEGPNTRPASKTTM